MTKTKMIWALALGLFLPTASRAQQDPALVARGAQVYAGNCGRCHNARASTERTDGEWVVIVMHMRARANLTKADANAVLVYLQATNLPEGGGAEDSQQASGSTRHSSPNVVMPAQLRIELAKRGLVAKAAGPDRRQDPGAD